MKHDTKTKHYFSPKHKQPTLSSLYHITVHPQLFHSLLFLSVTRLSHIYGESPHIHFSTTIQISPVDSDTSPTITVRIFSRTAVPIHTSWKQCALLQSFTLADRHMQQVITRTDRYMHTLRSDLSYLIFHKQRKTKADKGLILHCLCNRSHTTC